MVAQQRKLYSLDHDSIPHEVYLSQMASGCISCGMREWYIMRWLMTAMWWHILYRLRRHVSGYLKLSLRQHVLTIAVRRFEVTMQLASTVVYGHVCERAVTAWPMLEQLCL